MFRRSVTGSPIFEGYIFIYFINYVIGLQKESFIFMIIIGFPGIGKSTLACNDCRFIDLESSYFKTPDARNDDWVVEYCKLAELLSKNGSIVFVSSHKAVRDYIAKMRTDELVACIFPSERIREQWVKKLEDRYMNSGLDKDYRAFIRARDHYDDYIRELYSDDGIPYKWVITDINYNLEEEIDKLFDCISYSSETRYYSSLEKQPLL